MSLNGSEGQIPSGAPTLQHSGESVTSDKKVETQRPPSLATSCTTAKSDNCLGESSCISGDENTSDARAKEQQAPSDVSMKSVLMVEPSDNSGDLSDNSCGVCGQESRENLSMACGHSLCKLCISNVLHQPEQLEEHCLQCDGDALQLVMTRHKTTLKRRFEDISEGPGDTNVKMSLKKIYTELYITEGESESVNTEHEMQQLMREFKRHTRGTRQETPIKCNDIFKQLPGQNKIIQTVLTKGIAGIGKTVSVHKFILDWTEGNANKDIDFMFILPFREMNLVKDHLLSLHDLIILFHPEVTGLDPKIYESCRVLFIFDGLDESRLQVNFKVQQEQFICSVNDVTSLSNLITNLFNRNLLPSALIWLTSRPAAAAQIPARRIDQVTEVRGFNHPQKEEYFKRRISDESQANRVISHIKSSRSLYIMCHIPVFCWITATVLGEMVISDNNPETPKTLTEMFAHFLLVQMKVKSQKYHGESESDKLYLLHSNKRILMSLAELAYQQLELGNILFYEEDLRTCGIEVDDASVYSGMCTEIFREESMFGQKRVYCFVHLSIQEFLAAIYVFHSAVNVDTEALKAFPAKGAQLHHWLISAVDRASKSENGHLDLFLRFLLGCTAESNQTLLQGLVPYTHDFSKSLSVTVKHIKEKISAGETSKHDSCRQRSMNLLLCLLEMKDNSLHEEIQHHLDSGKQLSFNQCSALANMLLMSDDVLDEFDLSKYNTSDGGALLIAVSAFKKAKLAGCGLWINSCTTLSNAIQSAESHLTELDLSYNQIQDDGVKILVAGLTNIHCKLETLTLAGCFLTDQSCLPLSSVLQCGNSSLKDLDMSFNQLTDTGIQMLSVGLSYPSCKLEICRLKCCDLSEESCKFLGKAANSNLRMLDLTNNDLGDSGAHFLSLHLKDPHCKLETLILSGCLISETGCDHLTSALKSNPSGLRELDLSYNHPGASGVKGLISMLKNTDCKLEKLNTEHDSECWLKPGPQKYACELTLDPDTANSHILLSEENRKLTYVFVEQLLPDKMERFENRAQVLCKESLMTRCYWESEYIGRVYLALSYNSIKRTGRSESLFGSNDKSWRLTVFNSQWSFWHKERRILSNSSDKLEYSQRIGIYLDWLAGTLMFYCVSPSRLTLLCTYQATFTKPLYAGFGVYNNGFWESSISLCSVTNTTETTYDDSGMDMSDSQCLTLGNGCNSCKDKAEDSSSWTLVNPSVSEETGITVYKHSSSSGSFECAVSGLRWVCAGEVTLEYHFSGSCIMPGIVCAQYKPIGPLMDIKVLSGELLEAHLPHFACLEGSDSSLRNAVRVLHGSESGVTLETCELTRFHAKLFKPTFSPKQVLVRFGIPVKIHLDVLLYRTSIAPLTLLTYVVPRDASMIEAVGKDVEDIQDVKRIKKPRPNRSIRMNTKFSLKVSPCQADISPSEIRLNYIKPPNLFEAVIENVGTCFDLELGSEEQCIWKATIRSSETGMDNIPSETSRHPREVIHSEVSHTRAAKDDGKATMAAKICSDETGMTKTQTCSGASHTSRPARSDEEEGRMDPMANKTQLFMIRPEIIKRTSAALLKDLLDKLQAQQPPVISSREAEEVLQRTSVLQDQVTFLIDMVLKKGGEACGVMLSLLKELDSYLSNDLGL